jgi:hypothetical protein
LKKNNSVRCSVFNLLLDNLIVDIIIKFNQDSFDLIIALGNLLELELNNSFSNILSKLFNMPIDELELKLKFSNISLT